MRQYPLQCWRWQGRQIIAVLILGLRFKISCHYQYQKNYDLSRIRSRMKFCRLQIHLRFQQYWYLLEHNAKHWFSQHGISIKKPNLQTVFWRKSCVEDWRSTWTKRKKERILHMLNLWLRSVQNLSPAYWATHVIGEDNALPDMRDLIALISSPTSLSC